MHCARLHFQQPANNFSAPPVLRRATLRRSYSTPPSSRPPHAGTRRRRFPPRPPAGHRLPRRQPPVSRPAAPASRRPRRHPRSRAYRPPARRTRVRGSGRPFLPHHQHRRRPGRRPQPLECRRSVGTVFQRQNPRTARDPCHRRPPAVEQPAHPAPAGHHHPGHAGLVRLGCRWRRRARRDRHTLRPLHQPPAIRRRLPSLLPLQPYPRFGRRPQPAAGGSRSASARRAQRLHVHRLHPRHAPVFHEGKPGPPRRLHRVLR